MTGNNPNIDRVNMNAYIMRFSENLSVLSQNIEQKRNFGINQRSLLWYNVLKRMCNNPNLNLVNINAYTKFCENLSVWSQNIEPKQSRTITLIQLS